MGNFDSRVDKGIFLGYSRTSKEYKCFNLMLNKVMERINVMVDETSEWKIKEEEKDLLE